jgi:putative SOS response-associated peptidase YedK
MCGRFTHKLTWREIHALYRLTSPPSNLQLRFNICPTTTINTVIEQKGERQLVPMRWGLVPAWWSKTIKDVKLATFYARAETVAEKPFFRSAFKRRPRCIIPASGYYEWEDAPGGKQPWYFTRKDGAPVSIAGIWDEWTDRETGTPLQSCAMVICNPNAFVAEVHDRMPVILERENFQTWLTGEARAAASLMLPAGERVLQKWPVSKRVNSSRANDGDETLIERQG